MWSFVERDATVGLHATSWDVVLSPSGGSQAFREQLRRETGVRLIPRDRSSRSGVENRSLRF